MNQIQNCHKLILKQGDPFQAGSFIYLDKPQTIIGRANPSYDPDFSIHNQFVSRKHFVVFVKDGIMTIQDLGSKHGTELNGEALIPFEIYRLHDSDTITLANGLIELQMEKDYDETMEIPGELLAYHLHKDRLDLDDIAQTVYFHDTSIKLSQKEYACCKILAENLNEFVSKQQIIDAVWPERTLSCNVYVGTEEMNSLIYRLRMKVRGYLKIESVLRKGFRMSRSDVHEID
jgi:pSer/pThr/pTyr-binding forkhead associated (FHA) protein